MNRFGKRRAQQVWIGLGAGLLGCGSADAEEPQTPPPPQPGQFAVSLPATLPDGSNRLYFIVVRYDGTQAPPLVDRPLGSVTVAVDGEGTDTESAHANVARFITHGPSLVMADGTARRANYVVDLELHGAGSQMIEFALVDGEQRRQIWVPVEVVSDTQGGVTP